MCMFVILERSCGSLLEYLVLASPTWKYGVCIAEDSNANHSPAPRHLV